MPDAPSILSTKLLDEASRDFAGANGWTLREESFIETTTIYSGCQSGFSREAAEWRHSIRKIARAMNGQSLAVFTSEKSLEYLPMYWLSDWQPGEPVPSGHPDFWQIACLSGRTLQEVKTRFREEQVVCTAKNAKELASAIITDGRFTNAVFFCALEHRPELPLALRQAGIQVAEVPVYKTIGQPKVIDTPFDGVLFFSPSGVESFFQANRLPPGGVCFAIGETTADTIKSYTDERIIVSHTPTQGDLIRCVQFYYDNKQCYL